MGGDGAEVALTVAGGAALFSLGCFLGGRTQPEAKPEPDPAAKSLALRSRKLIAMTVEFSHPAAMMRKAWPKSFDWES